MPSILGYLAGGALAGGGAAMEDQAAKQQERDWRTDLAKQEAQASYDRQVALQRMQADTTWKLHEEDYKRQGPERDRQYNLKEREFEVRSEETKEARLSREGFQRQQIEERQEDRASRERQHGQTMDYYRGRDKMLDEDRDRREGRLSGGGNKIPEVARLQLQDYDKEQSKIDDQIGRVREGINTDPGKAGMKGEAEAYVKGLEKKRDQLEFRKNQVLAKYDPEGMADRLISADAPNWKNLDDATKFARDSKTLGGDVFMRQIEQKLHADGHLHRLSAKMDADKASVGRGRQQGEEEEAAGGIVGPKPPANLGQGRLSRYVDDMISKAPPQTQASSDLNPSILGSTAGSGDSLRSRLPDAIRPDIGVANRGDPTVADIMQMDERDISSMMRYRGSFPGHIRQALDRRAAQLR